MNLLRKINTTLEAQRDIYLQRLRNIQAEILLLGKPVKGSLIVRILTEKQTEKRKELEKEITYYQGQVSAIDNAIEAVFNAVTNE